MVDGRDRRSILRAGAALCSLSLAGCIGDGGDDSAGNESDADGMPGDGADGNGTDGTGNVSDGDGTGGDTDGNSTDDGGDPGGEDPDWETIERWPQFQYDARNTGYVHANTSVENLEERWSYEVGETLTSSPVVADDTVYVASRSGTAYAVREGEVEWSSQLGGEWSNTVPVLYDDLVIFPTEKRLVALDRADGSDVWALPLDGEPEAITLADGTLYFPTYGDTTNEGFFAVDAASGDKHWSTDPHQIHLHDYAAPHEEELFVTGGASGEPEVSALNVDEGLARSAIDLDVRIYTGVAIRDGIAYLGTDDGVYAQELGGKMKWRHQTDFPVDSPLTVTENTVVARATGEEKEDGSELLALERNTGEERWSNAFDGRNRVAPVVVGKSVFSVTNSFGTIAAHGLTTGDQLWTQETKEGPREMAFMNGRYYLTTDFGGTIYCFGPQ